MKITTNGNLILDDIKNARYDAGHCCLDNATLANVFDQHTADFQAELREAGREPSPRHLEEFTRNAEVAAVLRAAARTATTDLPTSIYNVLVAGVPFDTEAL